jgi:hypothetical protein
VPVTRCYIQKAQRSTLTRSQFELICVSDFFGLDGPKRDKNNKIPMKTLISYTTLLLTGVFAVNHHATAQLQPMDDAQMEQTIGQAYIEMESRLVDDNKISRVTFGQTVKIQANADSLTLGAGYNNGVSVGTDFNASNISLGYIDTATNTIVPFEFTNPYFEWAVDNTATTSKNNMMGFRIGFEDAKGVLQGDFTNFSGNIGMTINGNAASLFTAAGGTATNNRATYIGDSAGSCTDGVDCVSLANIQSLKVGSSNGTSGTADFFLSFQKNTLNWGSGPIASKGFFMNVPTSTNLNVTATDSSTGRLATEFIDRGVGVGRWNVAPTP